MSGRRISKSERSIIKQGRRYVKTSREFEFYTLGNNAESTKFVREVSLKTGRAVR